MGTSVDRALELPKVGWGEGTGCLFAHPPYCLAEGCWGWARCCPGWLWHRCQCWQLKGSGGPAAWACPGGVAGAPTASAELTDPRPGGLAGPLGRGLVKPSSHSSLLSMPVKLPPPPQLLWADPPRLVLRARCRREKGGCQTPPGIHRRGRVPARVSLPCAAHWWPISGPAPGSELRRARRLELPSVPSRL